MRCSANESVRRQIAADSSGTCCSIRSARRGWQKHVVRGAAVVPAAAIVQTMFAAARDVFGEAAAAIELRKITLAEAIPFGRANAASPRLGGHSHRAGLPQHARAIARW